jgi:hypothetical protein
MKITLNVEHLSVASFDVGAAEGDSGLFAISDAGTCRCTVEVGCYYQTMYCTGNTCVLTAAFTCETASNSPC